MTEAADQTTAPEPAKPDRIRVPDVTGRQLTGARRARTHGFHVEVVRRSGGVLVSLSREGEVITQHPWLARRAEGSTVTLVVANPPACDPNYTGACLKPNVGDYDCGGGAGDPPFVWTTVKVVGFDIFGLDGDNDGYGCD